MTVLHGFANSLLRSTAAVLTAALFVFGCSGGGGGGGGGGGVPAGTTAVQPLTVSANGSVDGVQCPAGQTTRFQYLSDFPVEDPIVGGELNVAKTFAGGTIEPGLVPILGEINPVGNIHVEVRIGREDSDDTCDSGFLLGSFDLPADGTPPDLENLTANQQSLNLINSGQYTACVEVTPTVDVTLTLPEVHFDVTDCQSVVFDLSGEWQGHWTCTMNCAPDSADDSLIFIEQDGQNARFTDAIAGTFTGTVCGNEFHFSGGYDCNASLTCDEVVTGTFAKLSETFGTMISSFIEGECAGDCEDALTRNHHRESGAYDIDFANEDWTIFSQIVIPAGSSTFSAETEFGAYRRTTLITPAGGFANVYHRSTERSYTPSTEGALVHLVYRWRSRNFAPGNSLVYEYPVVYQEQSDGSLKFFKYDIDQLAPTAWADVNSGFLASVHFIGPDGSEHPDFSSTGRRLWFGYKTEILNTSEGTVDLYHGMDDFSVVIWKEE